MLQPAYLSALVAELERHLTEEAEEEKREEEAKSAAYLCYRFIQTSFPSPPTSPSTSSSSSSPDLLMMMNTPGERLYSIDPYHDFATRSYTRQIRKVKTV